MYKISNQLVDIDSSRHFTVAQSNTRGHSASVLQSSCNSVVYATNSFFPQTVRDWNQQALFITELRTLSRAT